MSSEKKEFRLRVVEGREIYGASRSPSSEPFLLVKLKGLKHIFNSEKQTSDIHENIDNPVWNQDFLLHPKPNDIILVKVYDRNKTQKKNIFMGKVELNVGKYHPSLTDTWVPLVDKKGNKTKGEIHILGNYGGEVLPEIGAVAPVMYEKEKKKTTVGEGTTFSKTKETTKYQGEEGEKKYIHEEKTTSPSVTEGVIPEQTDPYKFHYDTTSLLGSDQNLGKVVSTTTEEQTTTYK